MSDWCMDEWEKWQIGGCREYAAALIWGWPRLRLGTFGDRVVDGEHVSDTESHYYAHDDQYAYDSAGRHPLPYLGVGEPADWSQLDVDPDDVDDPRPELIPEALAHIERNALQPTESRSSMSERKPIWNVRRTVVELVEAADEAEAIRKIDAALRSAHFEPYDDSHEDDLKSVFQSSDQRPEDYAFIDSGLQRRRR